MPPQWSVAAAHLPTTLAVASPPHRSRSRVTEELGRHPGGVPPPPPQASPCTGKGALRPKRRSSRADPCGARAAPRATAALVWPPAVAGITSRPPHRAAPQHPHEIQSTRRLAPRHPRAGSVGDGQGEGPVLLGRDLERRHRICFLLHRIGLLLSRIGFHRR